MTPIREIVLVHGVWAPGLVMMPLGALLAREGFRCHRFNYRGAGRPLAANADALARFARSVGPAHFVGHSLGGLVILRSLHQHPELAVGNVVLLGTPARGSFSGPMTIRATAPMRASLSKPKSIMASASRQRGVSVRLRLGLRFDVDRAGIGRAGAADLLEIGRAHV